ncbi:FHA domain-containing protein [Pontimonas sp.]|uniref:FHA domain-containing protein FhaB/FipA n=1 Tax=Pontimonas sp. TaxID=2304492 RepID=UPI0028706D32|nr:FHA domain-containing protein [Pontimonas sp.]MDR9396515.1 FHA domain-containing protein [Pontimonas sp.]MDR9434182.1 FHA domain-containing protein [Pontimonas sp.]
MSQLTLFVLQLAFLGLLWAFIFAIVYALRTDLFGPPMRRNEPTSPQRVRQEAQPDTQPTPTTPSGVATSLVVTSGPKEGLEIPLDKEEQFTIGRSAESSLVIRDDFTSTHHARLMLWNEQWMVQDLDSTNGTLLSGKRVSIPTPIPLDTPIQVGETTFELRR